MDVLIKPLYWLLTTVINLYVWVVVIGVVLSWLLAFNVVNPHNRVVYLVRDATERLTAPALRPIRRVLPVFGGLDLSPLVLILLLLFAERLLAEVFIAVVR